MSETALTKKEIEKLLVDTLNGLVDDDALFYSSDVGAKYCYLYENGENYLISTMNLLLGHLHMAKQAELEQRAKDMIIKGLNS